MATLTRKTTFTSSYSPFLHAKSLLKRDLKGTNLLTSSEKGTVLKGKKGSKTNFDRFVSPESVCIQPKFSR